MMDRITHYLVVFCQIAAVIIWLTLFGVLIAWSFGFAAAVLVAVVLILLLSGLLLMLIGAQDGA